MTSPPLLTLLSDFGLTDIYVGVMKGVIAQINPEIKVIDLTHQIPPQNIAAARFCLMSAYSYFLDKTVHLAVVDPGVGSVRRAIAVEFARGFVVAPDNGLISGVLSQSQVIRAVELTNWQYWRLPNPSHTFHGRDIFAPCAAHLASGVQITDLGSEIDIDSLIDLNFPKCCHITTGAIGCVQYIDIFGNLITNIPGSYVKGETWHIIIAGLKIKGGKTYTSVPVGDTVALVGSEGWVEIAINRGNAQEQLDLQLAETVELKLEIEK
ncbi:MAG: SAM-dependent chlorinase/fluorinase [Calothrix sp. C42_A2020_038]|nr:SAM-dependent chlorinase/fluorinase [Calothrix sp. C42_A2020_038]